MSDARLNLLPVNVQKKNLLYDFYGALLTEKQSAFFTMHYMEDFSLAEIGEHFGVTPQAVADLLKRTGKLLDGYEEKLKLVKKLNEQKESLRFIYSNVEKLLTFGDGSTDLLAKQILAAADSMLL